ncbi:MAG: energy transducer TonB [Inquilinus limosus]|uniref:Energy transducer TonB n=1 Tax=Inquilinus limosus TaxID=171674 RepID=A0A952FP59_9PROT|nr:energy transducer TonB [Inquilinus limosus]
MTRLRVTGRGVAYAASALIHGGVVWALLPSLTGSAAPTPAETPMAIEMAGFAGPSDAVDATEPVETAQAEPVEPTETMPPPPTETVPPETVQDQPVEIVPEEPPPTAESPETETAEIQPPEPTPETPPPELVTTTGETEAVVAAVPETVQATEPEIVPPPTTKPKPPAERRPQRRQPRPTQEPAEVAPAQQAALPPQPAAPPPAASSASSAHAADYQTKLVGYIQQRLNRANIRLRQATTITVRFTLHPDGGVEDPVLVTSSGNESVDGTVLRVLGRLSAPEPPSGFPALITAQFILQL